MHISADFVTECEKFLFQLKALQKRMQKNVSRFCVAQAVPEIYMKKEMLKDRGDVFFLLFTVHAIKFSFDLFCFITLVINFFFSEEGKENQMII